MEKNKPSLYNTNLTALTRQFLVPSWPKAFIYLLVGGLTLLLWNARTIWQHFDANLFSQNYSVGKISPQSVRLEKSLSHLLGGRVVQVLFWALAGCAIYVCVWFIISTLTNVRNDIVADEYVHPKAYSRRGYWQSVLGRKLFLGLTLVLLICAIIIALRILPTLAHSFYNNLSDFKLSSSLPRVLGAIAGATFIIYVLELLVRVCAVAWRKIYADL